MRHLAHLFVCSVVWSSCGQKVPEDCTACGSEAYVCPTEPAGPTTYDEEESCPEADGLSYLPPTAPNVLLLVDKSGSMYSHWPQLLQLTPYIEGMSDLTRPGLAVFPTDNDCSVDGAIQVPTAPGTGDEIMQAIEQTSPSGLTPLACALDAARLNGRLQDPHRENILVVVGDGEETCGGDPVAAMRAWQDLEEPVKVHFIAFAAPSEAREQLERMAQVAEQGFFYEADDISELVDRLNRVAASLDPCGYALEDRVEAVEVTLDGVVVDACTTADCVEGYVYDPEEAVVTLAPYTCREVAAQECPDIVFTER